MSITTEENIPKFTIGNKTISLKLTFPTVFTLAEKYDFHVLKLFVEEELTQRSMMQLLVDPMYTIDLCWYFTEPKVEFGKEEFHEKLGSAAGLDEVREAFWASIVNFSSPHIRKMLIEMWAEMKRELKRFKVDSPKSTTSSSEQSVEE